MRGGDIAGLLIRQARLQRDWSQEGLCRGICAPSYLSKIEQGKAAPSPEVTELLLHRLGLVWTPEPEGLAPCWKALLSGSPNFDSLYEQLVQPRREILASSPLAADALLLDAFYADEMRPLPVEWEPFLSTRQLALQRGLQGRWEEAVRLEKERRRGAVREERGRDGDQRPEPQLPRPRGREEVGHRRRRRGRAGRVRPAARDRRTRPHGGVPARPADADRQRPAVAVEPRTGGRHLPPLAATAAGTTRRTVRP